MELTKHQQEKSQEGISILASHNRLLIKGSAGTGKTTLSNEMIKSLVETRVISRFGITCSAPTHKALAILNSKTDLTYPNFRTLASVLCYQHTYDSETGEDVFKPKFNAEYPPLNDIKTLIIDEASMGGIDMLIYLERYGSKCTIIFIGDDKQLNPVKEKESPIFWGKPKLFDTHEEAFQYTLDHQLVKERIGEIYTPEFEKQFVGFKPYPEIELEEIVRQGADNPIIPLSRNLPAIFDYTQRLNSNGHGFVYATDFDMAVAELAKVNGTDDLKFLSYRNEEVDKVNLEVRKKIYTNPRRLELGESIIFDSPYSQYMTNDELKIETLDIDTIIFTVPIQDSKGLPFTTTDVSFKCYIINGSQIDEFGTGEMIWRGVFVIHEDSDAAFKNFGYALSAKGRARQLDQSTRRIFLAKFAKFKYNHALTIHKSQGSTYRRVILNVGDVNVNPNQSEKTRMLYTGVTRTSELLILYNVK